MARRTCAAGHNGTSAGDVRPAPEPGSIDPVPGKERCIASCRTPWRCAVAVTVATRMTAGAATIGELACLQDVVDVVDGRRAAGAAVAVVDDFGRLLGDADPADHPDLFGCTA